MRATQKQRQIIGRVNMFFFAAIHQVTAYRACQMFATICGVK